jgi:periplasmic divalent cation tolerance protein
MEHGCGADGLVQVSTAAASVSEAQAIARALVDEGLAACVQVLGPVESRFRWRGSVQVAQEWLCVAKTHARRLAAVEAAIRAVHSYEVPEIIVTAIIGGSAEYLQWLDEQTR